MMIAITFDKGGNKKSSSLRFKKTFYLAKKRRMSIRIGDDSTGTNLNNKLIWNIEQIKNLFKKI